MNEPNEPSDIRLELAKLIIDSIKELYPEYFHPSADENSLEHMSDLFTSYVKWKEDYRITREWIGDFPTMDIYNSYIRYCLDNHMVSMTKKLFYRTLETDFNLDHVLPA